VPKEVVDRVLARADELEREQGRSGARVDGQAPDGGGGGGYCLGHGGGRPADDHARVGQPRDLDVPGPGPAELAFEDELESDEWLRGLEAALEEKEEKAK
jgi:hypothetical protein